MTSTPNPYAFLSHASSDKPFARRLDAALSVAGVRIFLDERSIAIGESIAGKVYGEIDAATHLIYVISQSSLASRWAKDELEAAKFRQNSGGAITVLPVVIDESEIPCAIKHIKYADFRAWNEPVAFAKAVHQLLLSMGVAPPQFTQHELLFFARYYSQLNDLEQRTIAFANYVYGALAAEYAVRPVKWPQEADCTRVAIKWEVDDDIIHTACHALLRTTINRDPADISSVESTVITLTKAFLNLLNEHGIFRGPSRKADEYRELADAASRLSASIRSIRQNNEVINPSFISSLVET